MKIEIELTEEQSNKIRDFWEKGAFVGAIFGQPLFSRRVRRDDKCTDFYILRCGMYSPEEAQRIKDCLTKINEERKP